MGILGKFRQVIWVLILGSVTNAAMAANSPIIWEGDTSTSWTEGANWVGDLAPLPDDHAKFTGTFANQPTLTGATSVGGIWITGLGQALGAVANDNVLSIGGNTIDGKSNIAVLFNASSGFDAAINNKIVLMADNLIIRNDTDNLLSFGSATNSTSNPVVNLNGNTLTYSNNGAGSISLGNVGGAGNVTIDNAGTGAVVTNSNNTHFTGQLTVARGVLQSNSVNNSAANGKLGNSSLPVILGSSGNAGVLRYNGGTASSTKAFSLATNGTGMFDMQPTATATLTISGVISGDGALVVNGNSMGTLLLSGVNTYTGGTMLASGTLSLGRDTVDSITSGAIGTGTLTLTGGTLTANATRSIVNPIVTGGSVGINPTSAMTLGGSLTSTNDSDVIDVGTGTSSLNFSGDISGYSGTFIRNSTDGTLNCGSNNVDASHARIVMTGANSGVNRYLRFGDSATGTMATIRIGELSGGGVVNPAAGGLAVATMEVGSLNTNAEFSGAILGRASQQFNVTKVGTGELTLSGPSSYGGNDSPGTTTVSSGTLIAGANAVSTLINNVSASGTASDDFITTTTLPEHGLQIGDQVTFQGGPTGGLAAVTTYYVVGTPAPDRIQVSATPGGAPIVLSANQPATLTIAEVGAFGSGTTAIEMGDSNTGSNNVTLLTGGPYKIERAVHVTSNGSGMSTIGGNTNDNSSFTGEISLAKNVRITSIATGGNMLTVSGAISGAGFGIEKVGSGVASLTAANNYSGSTTVSEGTLLVNGAHTGGGAYDVASGATLGGFGSIDAGVAVSAGGNLAPGAGIGNLAVGSANIDGTLHIEYNGDSSTIDKLTVAGSLDIASATLDFDNLALVPLSGNSYVLASYGTLAGSDSFASVIDLPAGYTLDYHYSGNQIALVSTGGLAGDFDSDGDVDGADFIAWQTHYPTNGGAALAMGDANGDGNVNGADFALWQSAFPTSPSATTAVPEPGTLLLAAFGVAAVCIGVRQNR